MGYTIRQMEPERNFCQELTVEALQRAVTPKRSTRCCRRGAIPCAEPAS
jgi:hypothetical protein